MRAIELHIKLGKRVAATVSQLGHPMKNALKGWCREYERQHDLPKASQPRRTKYSRAQK